MVLVLFAMLFCSCDNLLPHKTDSQSDGYDESENVYYTDPEYYQSQIEDVVKYRIALANAIIKKHNEYNYSAIFDKYMNLMGDFRDVVREWYLAEDAKNGYEVVLSKMARDYNNTYYNIAKDVLVEYKRLNIILSDYQRISTSTQTKLWQFRELKTGIGFTFCYYLENNGWQCTLDKESYSRYIDTNL